MVHPWRDQLHLVPICRKQVCFSVHCFCSRLSFLFFLVGQPYSWEAVDSVSANYTPDITPLILAAHKNNYEILKILLDRGASLPTPHDLKCSCDSCIMAFQEDSLRFSLSRINAYKALASPSLIALTSSDAILTAFQLSDELKKLGKMESQFRAEYTELRNQRELDNRVASMH